MNHVKVNMDEGFDGDFIQYGMYPTLKILSKGYSYHNLWDVTELYSVLVNTMLDGAQSHGITAAAIIWQMYF
jgi:hypothetical protein